MIDKFIDCYEDTGVDTVYDAGVVSRCYGKYMIANSMYGAEATFSIGQPVYDRNKKLMGYLGIGLFENLDYSADVRIPVEHWTICMPTEYCVEGKKVFTYWQTREADNE